MNNFISIFIPDHLDPVDIEPVLKEKKYTVERIVNEAKKFFMTLGWPDLPKSFMEKSMFTRPKNKKQIPSCQGSAWDFFETADGAKDVR